MVAVIAWATALAIIGFMFRRELFLLLRKPFLCRRLRKAIPGSQEWFNSIDAIHVHNAQCQTR